MPRPSPSAAASGAGQLVPDINHSVIGGNSECPLDQGLDYEIQLFALLASSRAMREGTSAFLEKRTASFTGR